MSINIWSIVGQDCHELDGCRILIWMFFWKSVFLLWISGWFWPKPFLLDMRCQAYWTNPLISGPLWAKTAISSMAADTKTKDDWPLSLPPPPKFNVPPPPIPAFVEACLHQQEQDSTVRQNGGTYNFYFRILKICNIFHYFVEITQLLIVQFCLST